MRGGVTTLKDKSDNKWTTQILSLASHEVGISAALAPPQVRTTAAEAPTLLEAATSEHPSISPAVSTVAANAEVSEAFLFKAW